jgi:hypothetical protein
MALVAATGWTFTWADGPTHTDVLTPATWAASKNDPDTSLRYWVGASNTYVTTAKSIGNPPAGATVIAELLSGNATAFTAHINVATSSGIGTACNAYLNVQNTSYLMTSDGSNVTIATGLTGNATVYGFFELLTDSGTCKPDIIIAP